MLRTPNIMSNNWSVFKFLISIYQFIIDLLMYH